MSLFRRFCSFGARPMGDDSGDGVGHHKSDPDAPDAHRVVQQVHEGHRADHVTKQAAEGGGNDFLNRLDVKRKAHVPHPRTVSGDAAPGF